MLKNKLNNHGDTLVEVLISVALVSVVLSAGYVGSNRAYQNIQDAQEHQIATSIAQAQLELLNANSLPNNSQLPGCYYQATAASPYAFTQVLANCDPYHLPPPETPYPENFSVSITNVSPGVHDKLNTYQIEVLWPSSTGSSRNDDIRLFYQTGGS